MNYDLVRIKILRRYLIVPVAFTVHPNGAAYAAYGFTVLQAKNRLLKKVGALSVFPPHPHM